MKKTKILITGGAGNVGSALTKSLVISGNYEVVVADNLITGDIKKLPKTDVNFSFIKCDVNDYDEIAPIMLSNRFDFVVPRFVNMALKNQDITIYGDGSQTRT